MTGGPGQVPSTAFVLGMAAGGTGRHVRSLAAGLTARGVDVTVFGPAITQRLFRFTEAGARFTAVEIADRPRPASDLAAVARLRRVLRRPARSGCPPPAVVHAHGLRAGGLCALALGGVILPARRRGRPAFIVTLHNAPPRGGAVRVMIYVILEWIVARRADRVLCVSGDLAARMRRRGVARVARAVVPAPAVPGVPAAAARRLRDSLGAAGRPLVLAVGRLAPQKGFATLLAATARLRGDQPEPPGWPGGAPGCPGDTPEPPTARTPPLVVIAGDGPLRAALAAQIDSQRLPVKLLGRRDDIPALLAAADVFVLPSMWEGQPLILQEALRAGLPVVATRAGGIPGITGDDAALLVPPGDPEQLAAALARVLTEPGLAARIAAAATKRGRALPDEEAAVEAALAGYREALARLAAPPAR